MSEIDQRKKIILTKIEFEALIWFFKRNVFSTVIVIIVNLILLFFGFKFLMSKISFPNYGIFRAASGEFFFAYLGIALINLFLMALVAVIVLYLSFHDIIMPILRIQREIKECIEKGEKVCVRVRKTDRIIFPLVDLINKIEDKK